MENITFRRLPNARSTPHGRGRKPEIKHLAWQTTYRQKPRKLEFELKLLDDCGLQHAKARSYFGPENPKRMRSIAKTLNRPGTDDPRSCSPKKMCSPMRGKPPCDHDGILTARNPKKALRNRHPPPKPLSPLDEWQHLRESKAPTAFGIWVHISTTRS